MTGYFTANGATLNVMLLTAVMFSAIAVLPQDKTIKPEKPAATVRVYVFSDEDKDRVEAAREVRDALAKKKGVQMVNSRDEADVLVEVTEREQREGASGGFGGKQVTNMGETIIRVRVSHPGGEASELKGVGQGTWGRAAKDAADRVEKWIHRGDPEKPKK
jgi:hypothetical protein